jgi:hypothetical protein
MLSWCIHPLGSELVSSTDGGVLVNDRVIHYDKFQLRCFSQDLYP